MSARGLLSDFGRSYRHPLTRQSLRSILHQSGVPEGCTTGTTQGDIAYLDENNGALCARDGRLKVRPGGVICLEKAGDRRKRLGRQ